MIEDEEREKKLYDEHYKKLTTSIYNKKRYEMKKNNTWQGRENKQIHGKNYVKPNGSVSPVKKAMKAWEIAVLNKDKWDIWIQVGHQVLSDEWKSGKDNRQLKNMEAYLEELCEGLGKKYKSYDLKIERRPDTVIDCKSDDFWELMNSKIEKNNGRVLIFHNLHGDGIEQAMNTSANVVMGIITTQLNKIPIEDIEKKYNCKYEHLGNTTYLIWRVVQ